MMLSALTAEPIENTEPKDPIEPMEHADPTHPIESTEFFEPMLRSELSDHRDHFEFAIRLPHPLAKTPVYLMPLPVL